MITRIFFSPAQGAQEITSIPYGGYSSVQGAVGYTGSEANGNYESFGVVTSGMLCE